jgi:hypothetical protein
MSFLPPHWSGLRGSMENHLNELSINFRAKVYQGLFFFHENQSVAVSFTPGISCLPSCSKANCLNISIILILRAALMRHVKLASRCNIAYYICLRISSGCRASACSRLGDLLAGRVSDWTFALGSSSGCIRMMICETRQQSYMMGGLCVEPPIMCGL